MFFHKIKHLGKRIARYHRVRIDKEQIGLGRLLFGEIAPLAESQIFLGINPNDLGEKLLDLRQNRFARTVIQHDNLRINALARIANGL